MLVSTRLRAIRKRRNQKRTCLHIYRADGLCLLCGKVNKSRRLRYSLRNSRDDVLKDTVAKELLKEHKKAQEISKKN